MELKNHLVDHFYTWDGDCGLNWSWLITVPQLFAYFSNVNILLSSMLFRHRVKAVKFKGSYAPTLYNILSSHMSCIMLMT